jgi:hypothetical protein
MQRRYTYFYTEDWGEIQPAYAAARTFFISEAARIGQSWDVIAYPAGGRRFDPDMSHQSLRTASGTISLVPTLVTHPHTRKRCVAWNVQSEFYGDIKEEVRMTPSSRTPIV